MANSVIEQMFKDAVKIGVAADGKSVLVGHIEGFPYLCVKDRNDLVTFIDINTVKSAVEVMDIVRSTAIKYHVGLALKNVEGAGKEP